MDAQYIYNIIQGIYGLGFSSRASSSSVSPAAPRPFKMQPSNDPASLLGTMSSTTEEDHFNCVLFTPYPDLNH